MKQYALPVSLCLSLSSSQQDAAAKNLLILFRHINKVMTRSTQSTPSLALRSEKDLGSTASSLDNTPSAVPKLQKDTIAQEKSIVASPISNRRRDHLIGFLEALIIEEVTEASISIVYFINI